MATAQRLAAEIDTLTTRSEEIRSAMTGQEATAKQQDLEAAKVLQDHRGELADLQNAVTATREELREIQSGKCTAGAALTATRTELQETHAAKLIARSELQETEAAAADARTALQETQLAATAARKALHESQTAVLAARAAAEELSATITTAGAELLAIQENLSQSRAATAVEDGKMLAQQQALETLELQQSILGSKISSWDKREAAVASAEAKLQEKEVAKVSLRQEWQEIEMARDAAQSALTTALAAQSTLAGESAALQARLEHLRRETDGAEALNSKVTDLRQQQAEAGRRLEYLNDRLAGMSEAPDPNWGTVHTLARSFIKKLDLIDDLIAHLSGQPASTATLEQLSVFRCGLLDVLKEYSIESYSLEPGTVIDVAARKRIQIVESLSEGSHDGTRIVRTYRPGYVCLNGDLGISTLLRKADVAVSIPLG